MSHKYWNQENKEDRFSISPAFPHAPKGTAQKRMKALRAALQQDVEAEKKQAEQQTTSARGMQAMDIDELPVAGGSKTEQMDWNSSGHGKNDSSIEGVATSKKSINSPANLPLLPKSLKGTNNNYQPIQSTFCWIKELDESVAHNFYVIDTCVYIDSLSGIDKLLRYCEGNHSFVVLPYQVLNELDKLKLTKPALHNEVKLANQFLHANLMVNKRLLCQHPSDEQRRITRFQTWDDSILNCAMQVKQQLKNGEVSIITQDLNLRNKAIVTQIGQSTIDDILEKLSTNFEM